MNEQFNSDADSFRSRENAGYGQSPGSAPSPGDQAKAAHVTRGPLSTVDFWTFFDLVLHRWHWLAIGCILGGACLFELSWAKLIKPKFTAKVELFRYETPGVSESLKGTPLSSESFASLIVSPDLLRRVGDRTEPRITPDKLVKQIKVDPQPESDLVRVFVAAPTPDEAVKLANMYAEEAVLFTQGIQATQATQFASYYLERQLQQMDMDITSIDAQIRGLPVSAQVTNKLTQVSNDLNALNQNLAVSPRPSPMTMQLSEKLQSSFAELSELTSKYTDIHPLVQQKRAQIESLRVQIARATTNSAAFMPNTMEGLLTLGPGGHVLDPKYEANQSKLKSLQEARIEMANRELEAQLYASSPPGMARVFSPATLKTVEGNHRRIKVGLATIFGALLGMSCSVLLVLFTEVVDDRLKNSEDLKRVTRLPVLATLGDLTRMTPGRRAQWAFRAWTMLQGRLSLSQNHGLVCGITSSLAGEGRSTWIRLLADAASLSGFRVLTIATKPSPTHFDPQEQLTEGNPSQQSETETEDSNTDESMSSYGNSGAGTVAALTPNVLSTPSQVTERLTDPNAQPMVHIPLPGWVWNLERRKQWGSALHQWRQIDNLVIFVELPPASVSEAVLLGSNLPNLIWLAESGVAHAGETRTQLETLRNARCNLVGAVFNREHSKPIKRRFPRWLTALALIASLHSSVAQAQITNVGNAPLPVDAPAPQLSAPTEMPVSFNTNYSFSVVSPAQRASWQRHLTLGPGDVLNFGLYGEPLLARTEVMIAPDGRVSYLEAQDVVATGLTVDELRTQIDTELSRYRRAARSIVTPVSFRSKKYFVLGKVVQKGVYTLDRPTTVIEAVARAKGIENGLLENDTVDLADYSRSFLMRGGKRYSLDFEKLFREGDLSQNIAIEPGDYIYFPSADVKQVYVLGEVGLPGPVVYRSDMTVLAAISGRGGFNEKSYKSRVLVIRGSLNHPDTFIADTMGMTSGRLEDFKLKPKDIVYVSHRPWYRVEELLDLATTAFIQSAVTVWTGQDVLTP